MSKVPQPDEKPFSAMTKQMVLDYIHAHPEFLHEHPELLEILVPPEQKTGADHVLDFQHYALDNLRSSMQNLKDKFDGLLTSARDNMSVQAQVHEATLRVIKARDLEQLLEVLTIDLVSLFGIDVVRIAMESEVAEFYDSYYGEHNYSGLSFIPLGITELALEGGADVVMVADTMKHLPIGFDEIFSDCSALIQSCALLRLELTGLQRFVIIAFGTREPGHFHPQQGTELLSFLAQVIEHKLDACLTESEIERLL